MARPPRRTRGAPGSSARRASAVSSPRRPAGRTRPSGATRDRTRPAAGTAVRGAGSALAGRWAQSSTKRIAVLMAILVVLMLMLIPTLRGYLSQRAQIAALQEEVATRQENVRTLDAELARWEDPAHIEKQARERLKYVRPGETRYQVLGAEGLTGRELATSGSVVRPDEQGMTPWYGRIWESLDATDSLSPKDVDAPLAPISPGATGGETDVPGTDGSSSLGGVTDGASASS